MYMMTHPGKKLNFMGGEFGQLREWDEKREQDWDLRRYPLHDGFYHYMAALNHIYLESPALWAQDYEAQGFQWLDCHRESQCLYAFERRGGGRRMAAVFNFSGAEQAFEIPAGREEEIAVAVDAAVGAGARNIAAWSYDGDRTATLEASGPVVVTSMWGSTTTVEPENGKVEVAVGELLGAREEGGTVAGGDVGGELVEADTRDG